MNPSRVSVTACEPPCVPVATWPHWPNSGDSRACQLGATVILGTQRDPVDIRACAGICQCFGGVACAGLHAVTAIRFCHFPILISVPDTWDTDATPRMCRVRVSVTCYAVFLAFAAGASALLHQSSTARM